MVVSKQQQPKKRSLSLVEKSRKNRHKYEGLLTRNNSKCKTVTWSGKEKEAHDKVVNLKYTFFAYHKQERCRITYALN